MGQNHGQVSHRMKNWINSGVNAINDGTPMKIDAQQGGWRNWKNSRHGH
jgi:hypothetical protein